MAAYLFNEGGGLKLYDAVGRTSQTATATGTPTWTSGLHGKAIRHDTAGQLFTGGANPLNGAAVFSVSSWVNSSSSTFSNAKYATCDDSGGTGDGWFLGIDGNNPAKFNFSKRISFSAATATANSTLTVNKWTHLVGTVNAAGLITLYVDGIAQATTGTKTGSFTNTNSLTILSGTHSGSFINQQANLLIWKNRCLSPTNVQQLYADSFAMFRRRYVPTVIHAAAATGSGVGSSTGSSTASGVGASTAASVGSSTGAATSQATGRAAIAGVGSSAGAAAAQAIGAATTAGVGNSTGSATGSATGTSAAASVGNSTGASTAQSVGSSATSGQGVGNSTGSATAQAVGAASVASVASSTGSATAQAIGSGGSAGAGVASSAGTSTASAISAASVAAIFSAVGSSTAQAYSVGFVSSKSNDAIEFTWAVGDATNFDRTIPDALDFTFAISDQIDF